MGGAGVAFANILFATESQGLGKLETPAVILRPCKLATSSPVRNKDPYGISFDEVKPVCTLQ